MERAEVDRWLDAYVANVDRSWRNTNLLVWHKNLWLIDHGAALYFHHSWMSAEKFAALPYDASRPERSPAPAVPTICFWGILSEDCHTSSPFRVRANAPSGK